MNLTILVEFLSRVARGECGFEDLHPTFWDPALFSEDFHRALVRFHWSAIRFVPASSIDEQSAVSAVNQDGNAIAFIPRYLLTQEMCEIAVRSDPELLPEVPYARRNYAMCFSAIARHPSDDVLAAINDEWLDENLCKVFVHGQDTISFSELPQRLHIEAMCVAIGSSGLSQLGEIPQNLRTDRVCLAFAMSGTASIGELPLHLLNQEVINHAQFDNLNEVPVGYRSYDVCIRAVRNNPLDLSFVPVNQRTHEIVRSAVSQNGAALEFAGAILDDDIVSLAVFQNSDALQWVPDSMRTKRVAAIAAKDPVAIIQLPRSICDEDSFLDIAKHLTYKQFHKIRNNDLDGSLVAYLISICGKLLKYISPEEQTQELCRMAFANQYTHLEQLPIKTRSREACVAAIRVRPRSLEHVPGMYQFDDNDPDLCELAISADPRAIAFVPVNHPRSTQLVGLALALALDRDIKDMQKCQQRRHLHPAK